MQKSCIPLPRLHFHCRISHLFGFRLFHRIHPPRPLGHCLRQLSVTPLSGFPFTPIWPPFIRCRRTATIVLMMVNNLEAHAGGWRGARVAQQHTPLTAWIPPAQQQPQLQPEATPVADSSDDEAVAAVVPALLPSAEGIAAALEGGALPLPPHVYYLAGNRSVVWSVIWIVYGQAHGPHLVGRLAAVRGGRGPLLPASLCRACCAAALLLSCNDFRSRA